MSNTLSSPLHARGQDGSGKERNRVIGALGRAVYNPEAGGRPVLMGRAGCELSLCPDSQPPRLPAGTALLPTRLPALRTAGVSSGPASLISPGSVPAIPIEAGSVQRAWMSVPRTSRHGSGVPVSGMRDRDALAAC